VLEKRGNAGNHPPINQSNPRKPKGSIRLFVPYIPQGRKKGEGKKPTEKKKGKEEKEEKRNSAGASSSTPVVAQRRTI